MGRLQAGGAVVTRSQEITRAGDQSGGPQTSQSGVAVRSRLAGINPSEWTEIGPVAVKTRNISVAARVAAGVHQTRRRGVTNGVEWMCLARFRELCGGQS